MVRLLLRQLAGQLERVRLFVARSIPLTSNTLCGKRSWYTLLQHVKAAVQPGEGGAGAGYRLARKVASVGRLKVVKREREQPSILGPQAGRALTVGPSSIGVDGHGCCVIGAVTQPVVKQCPVSGNGHGGHRLDGLIRVDPTVAHLLVPGAVRVTWGRSVWDCSDFVGSLLDDRSDLDAA